MTTGPDRRYDLHDRLSSESLVKWTLMVTFRTKARAKVLARELNISEAELIELAIENLRKKKDG